MEDYLETIYEINRVKGVARVGEIASKLNVKSSSVNSALKYLSDHNLIVHEKYGYVGLTREGQKTAAVVKNKHDILFRFLTEFLMLDPKNAEKEACGIEHSISTETFERLTKFFQFLERGLTTERPKILSLFETYLKTGERIRCDCEEKRDCV